MQIIDYTNHIFETIIIDRIATWDDFCKHKPHRIKSVVTASGNTVLVNKSNNRDKHRYWHWRCIACERSGIVRVDVLKRWIDNDHKCRCKRKRKPYAATETHKVCGFCKRRKLLTTMFFYKSKAGYYSTNCKECSRLIAAGKRDTMPRNGSGVYYDRDMAGGNID